MAVVGQTVTKSPGFPQPEIRVERPIRRCRRYLGLMDPTSRVWFHLFKEIRMKPRERPTHRVTCRSLREAQ